MRIRFLEDVRREPDGRLEWTFVIDNDISGAHGTHIIGATRRWTVLTDPDTPVVAHDIYPTRADAPRITPEPELEHALKLHIHEELVRARLVRFLATPSRRAKELA
jgi:hypothetical protein